ncbi:hypothetical protein [Nocardia sp. alder85J]|uniref:hypothetical protein n=1 Tax=Nocardia sp. alder85J TaxID=2862949 RepID=UPI001CD29C07|nr:hypothetical protein [Nocardia sp. alder85J]MCX4097695.1 hypothetical protein [Nocardia sp. alder85J]
MTMSLRPRTPIRLHVAAALTVLAAGCASAAGPVPQAGGPQHWSPGALPPDPPHRPVTAATVLPPPLGVVDRADPDATARAALTVWYGQNTCTDRGPLDAAARAIPLLSAGLAAAVTGTSPVTGPGARWDTWARARAVAAVRIDASTETVPPPTDSEAIRVYVVTREMYGPQGDLVDTVTDTVGVLLRRDPARGWEVARVDPRG